MKIGLLSHGVKILKVSTVASIVLGLLVVAFLSFIAIFPSTLKDSIQNQLSSHSGLDIELSGISFGIQEGDLILELNNVDVYTMDNISIASVDKLKWNINLSTLYNNIDFNKMFNNFNLANISEDIYRPSAVYIDTLEIYKQPLYDRDVFGVEDIKRLFSSKILKALYFIQSLKIDKIIVEREQTIEINYVSFTRNGSQLVLTISGQDLGFESPIPRLDDVDIRATLATDKTDIDNFLTLPVTISNDELTMYGNLKIVSNRDGDFIEYMGYVPTLPVNQLHTFTSASHIGDEQFSKLKRSFVSGALNDVKLNIRSDLSQTKSAQVKLTSSMENVEFLYSKNKGPMKNIYASLSTDFNNLLVVLDRANLEDIHVRDAEVRITNLMKSDYMINIDSNLYSNTGQLFNYIKKFDRAEKFTKYLDKFTLTGKVSGTTTLTIPASGVVEKIQADLNVTDNELAILDGDLVVDKFSSNIIYKDKQIEVAGNGYIDKIGKINVQIPKSEVNKISINVTAAVDSQSQEVVEFIRDMRFDDSINKALDKFTLTGKVSGTTTLTIPASGVVEKIQADLNVTDNELAILDGDLVVDKFSSNIIYKDKQFSSDGDGFIRGIHFDIMLNPNNFYLNEENSIKIKLVNKTDGAELHVRKHKDNIWLAKLKSKPVSGDAVISLNNEQTPYVEINNLAISSLESFEGDVNISPNDLPSIRMSVQGINVNNEENYVPNFKVNLQSNGDVLVINNLVFEGVGVTNKSLSFNGAWYPGDKTSIMANAKGEMLSEFLNNLYIDEKVQGGKFDFDVRLFCDCPPWKMNYESIKGVLKLKVKEGVFTDKDPSIGRILSLLNIHTLAKRLQLDVSDVVQEGFAYEDIYAEIVIEDSFAKVKHFELNSTSSTIELSGESDIVNKVYNLDAQVHPSISEAVPAATFLAGGGLMGLGVWLVDQGIFDGKILDYFIDTVVNFKYKITGKWENPVVEFMEIN